MEGDRRKSGEFFSYRPVNFDPTGQRPRVTFVEFGEGEDFIMRPILNHLCLYESAKNGALDLADFARMNDALNVQAENERRIEASMPKPPGSR